jgi:hypothetical protein
MCGAKLINQMTSISSDLPQSVAEVVSALISVNFIQIFTEQSNLYSTQNAQQWKVSSKSLKWNNTISKENKKFLGLIILKERGGKKKAT